MHREHGLEVPLWNFMQEAGQPPSFMELTEWISCSEIQVRLLIGYGL